MNWWNRLWKKEELERKLDRELRFHFERQVAASMQDGMSEAEARRRARLEFGGLDQVKEECREARGTVWLETAMADLRFAIRTLRKSPAFTIAAIGTLALGIGANTAIFSVVNAVFLRPLSYTHPERVVWASEYFPRFKRTQMFTPEYAAWREQNTAFEHLEAFGISIGINLAGEGLAAERVLAGHVTPGFFTMLGVAPQFGRTFRPDEDGPDSRVAILSDALWRNSLRADPRVMQRTIVLNGVPTAVIGVMPPGFLDPGTSSTGVWLPDAVTAKSSVPGRSMGFLGGVIGRLKPGVTIEQARANLEVVARRMDDQYPTPWSSYHRAASVRVLPLQEQLTGESRTAIYVLMGAVGFILLIVCANVANMFLSRAVARSREIAIRAALGASRLRLMRLLLIESLILGAAGGLAGMVLMYWGISGLGFLIPAAIPPHIPIDWRVLGFAALCSVGASIAFGLVPAVSASRLDLSGSLKAGGLLPAQGWRRIRLRGALAVAQLALSLVLLVGAGLLTRSFLSLMSVNPGFDPHNVLLAEVSLSPLEIYSPTRQAEFWRRMLDAVQRVPGVEYAGVTDQSPLTIFQSLANGLAAEGQPETNAVVVPTSASANYFKALRIPLLKGRFFDSRDGNGARRVAILNQALTRILFPDTDPLGRRVRFGDEKDPWVTVVGVVADIRHRGLDDKVWPELYQPYEEAPSAWMSLVIKTSGEPASLIPAVRKTAAQIDRTQPLFNIESLEHRLSNSVAQRRQRMFLLGAFAVIALVIAMIGVYGVMVYSVTRRTHEIGVRIALGAQASDVRRMVVAEGLRMALVGTAIGVAGALALSRVLASFLYGVKPTDAATFVSVCILLIAVACFAAYLPARRATQVDPMVALRHE
ncbi:MAG TPA: ABC transporter permease [Bryobacteraceae bacterium]|nr:ABC transporter permease [Bryobacteraceae bacterium]